MEVEAAKMIGAGIAAVALGGAGISVAARGRDRNRILFHPPHEPFHPAVRQHDGGPHDAEGDGGFRRHARRDGRLAAAGCHGGPHGP